MKRQYAKAAAGIITIITIGILVLLLIDTYKSQNSIDGLTLVAKYKPFNLYIYADTASTNKFPDIIVRERDDPIYIKETRSNNIEIRHFENGKEVFSSHYDDNWNLVERQVRFYKGDDPMFTYVDTNGDGQFDFLIMGYKKPVVYARSNLCWVPFHN